MPSSASPTLELSISRDGGSTCYWILNLGNLIHHLTTLLKKFFIITDLNFYRCNLRPFPLSDMSDQEKTTVGTPSFWDKQVRGMNSVGFKEILKAIKSVVLEE